MSRVDTDSKIPPNLARSNWIGWHVGLEMALQSSRGGGDNSPTESLPLGDESSPSTSGISLEKATTTTTVFSIVDFPHWPGSSTSSKGHQRDSPLYPDDDDILLLADTSFSAERERTQSADDDDVLALIQLVLERERTRWHSCSLLLPPAANPCIPPQITFSCVCDDDEASAVSLSLSWFDVVVPLNRRGALFKSPAGKSL